MGPELDELLETLREEEPDAKVFYIFVSKSYAEKHGLSEGQTLCDGAVTVRLSLMEDGDG